MIINACATAPECTAETLENGVAVAIDILRATTTVLTALAHGAIAVYPSETIATAARRRSRMPNALLGGERGGTRIEGFDLGNSPAEYDQAAVQGRSIILTTTNGTRAIMACRLARTILIGGFVNLQALVQRLVTEPKITFVCAGTDGQPSEEDTLFAGAAIDSLRQLAGEIQWNEAARRATEQWRLAVKRMDQGETLFQILCESRGAQNLLSLGYDGDIQLAAKLNRWDLLAGMNPGGDAIVKLPKR